MTRTGSVQLNDAGVVTARINQGAKQSLADAMENLGACIDAARGVRRPLLVDISGSQPLDAEVRHFYTGELLVHSFSALALLVEASPLGRTMGNIYLRVARTGIPMKLFTDEPAAFSWLQGQRR